MTLITSVGSTRVCIKHQGKMVVLLVNEQLSEAFTGWSEAKVRWTATVYSLIAGLL
jgi:hypothetical protein